MPQIWYQNDSAILRFHFICDSARLKTKSLWRPKLPLSAGSILAAKKCRGQYHREGRVLKI